MANPESLMKIRTNNIDIWRKSLTEFETVLLPGYENRMVLLESLLGQDGLDRRLYETALKQLQIDPRDFNADRFFKSGYRDYLWHSLNAPLDMATDTNKYYEAYLQGDDSTIMTAESISPSFGRRLGMLGAERLLILHRNFLVLARSMSIDDQYDWSSDLVHPLNFQLKLDSIKESKSLYVGLKTSGHTPIELEELVGVTMGVVRSIHTQSPEK